MSALRAGAPLVPESVARLYRRAAKAWRSPAPPEAVAIAKLSRVVELHHRLASVIQGAVELSGLHDQERLLELSRQHTRMAHAVGGLVRELGGCPPRPEESTLELPRDLKELSYAQDPAKLIGLVREDRDYVAAAHRELTACQEIPAAMRLRLEAMSRDEAAS